MLNSLANSVSYLCSFILSIRSSIRINTVKEAPGPNCPVSLSWFESIRFIVESDLRDFSIVPIISLCHRWFVVQLRLHFVMSVCLASPAWFPWKPDCTAQVLKLTFCKEFVLISHCCFMNFFSL